MPLRRLTVLVAALLSAALTPFQARGQGAEWEYYTSATLASSAAALQGDHVWVGGEFGLMRYHPASGERTHFFTTNSGLPRIAVTALLAGAGDDLWVGTRDGGLALFDGTDWTVFDTANSELPSNTVNALTWGPTGSVWVGTQKGLVRIDRDGWTVYTPQNSGLPYDQVRAFSFDSTGVLWLSVNGVIDARWRHTITRFDGEYWSVSPKARYAIAFAAGRGGEVWVAMQGAGVCLYESFELTRCFHSLAPPVPVGDSVSALAFDRTGTLWVATTEGIGYWDGARWVRFFKDNGVYGFTAMLFAEDGTHWAAGGGPGLKRVVGADAEYIHTGSHEAIGYRTAFAIDGEGLWVAARGGLLHIRGEEWTHHVLPRAAPEFIPRSVAVAPDGHVWAAMPSMGLREFTGTEWIRHDDPNPPNPYSNGDAWSVAIEPSGAVWVGRMGPYFEGEGATRYHEGRWRRHTFTDNRIYDIEVTTDGAVWVATGDGVARFDGSTWQRHATPPTVYTEAVAEGPDGRMWVATLYGLSVYDGGTWRYEPIPDFEAEWGTHVRDVAVDRSGRVWAATYGGFAVLEDGAWTAYTPENSPLPARDVEKITVTDDGTAWMSLYGYGMLIYRGRRGAVSAEADPPQRAPARLGHSFPNPTRGLTRVPFAIGEGGPALLTVHDVLGRRVAVVVDAPLAPGDHEATWDAGALPSGTYLLRLQSGDETSSRALQVVR